jgi:hypothetical protein
MTCRHLCGLDSPYCIIRSLRAIRMYNIDFELCSSTSIRSLRAIRITSEESEIQDRELPWLSSNLVKN